MKWSDITTSPEYQALPAEAKDSLKQKYFTKVVLPKLGELPQGVTERDVLGAWVSKPDDSGQGLVSSMLASAGRGVATTVTAPVEGVGRIIGSDMLTEAGAGMQTSIEGVLPINPVFQDRFVVKAAGAAGQAVGMMALGGATGAVAKAAGAAKASSVAGNAMLSQGFLAGSAEGGRAADRLGLEGGEAKVRTLVGGFTEVVAEKLPFGMVAETGAVKRMLGETVESGGFDFVKAVGTEAVEGATAQIGSNVADITMAPEGVKTPGLLEGVGEAAALEAVGGAVFGGANVLTRLAQPRETSEGQPASTTPSSAQPQVSVTEPSVPLTPRMKLRGKDGNIYLRGTDGSWGTATFPSQKLDQTDVVQSAVLTDLVNKAQSIDKKLAAPVEKPKEAVVAKAAVIDPEVQQGEMLPDLSMSLEGQEFELDPVEFPDEKITPATNEPVVEGAEMVPVENIVTIPEDLARAEANMQANTERWQLASKSKEPALGIRGEDGKINLIDGHHRYLKAKAEGTPLAVKVIEPSQTAPLAKDVKTQRVRHETDDMHFKDLVDYSMSQGMKKDESIDYARGKIREWAQNTVDAANNLFGKKVKLGFFPATISKDGTKITKQGLGLSHKNGIEVDEGLSPLMASWIAAHEYAHQLFLTAEVPTEAKFAKGEVPPSIKTPNKNTKAERLANDFANWFVGKTLPEYSEDFSGKVPVELQKFFESQVKDQTQDVAEQKQGFKNTAIKRDIGAGFITADAFTYLIDFADEAIKSGKKAAQWAGDMLKQFGEGVRRYLQAAWKTAIKGLKATGIVKIGAEGIRMGKPAVQQSPKLSIGGFVGGTPFSNRAGNEGAPETPTLQKAVGIASKRRPFLRNFEELKKGMRLVKSSREGRTIDGVPVPETVYDVQTFSATYNAAHSMIDDLVFGQVSKEGVMTLLATGRTPEVPYELQPDERSNLSAHLMKSGRFVELGLTKTELVKIMQNDASVGSRQLNNWKYVLDPMTALRIEADEKTQAEMDKAEVPPFEELKAQIDTAVAGTVSAEAQAAINKVKRKLENKESPSDVMARVNALFYPEQKSLGDQVREDGAKAIADAFFRGKPKGPKGPLNQGNEYVKSELSSLLNETLDALGIERADTAKDKDEAYRRIIQELGLRDLRSAKLEIIDQLVSERIQEYADNGAYEFANDLADQWMQVSAHMAVTNASNTSLRRLVNRQLAENDTTLGKLAKMSATERYELTNKMLADTIARIKAAGSPEAGGVPAGIVDGLETDLRRTLKSMLDDAQTKSEQRAADKAKLASDPEAVRKANDAKAKRILDSMLDELSDTPTGGSPPQKKVDDITQIISEALTVEEGMLRLREYLVEAGVDDTTAAQIEMAVYESRRRKDYSDYLKASERKAEARKKAIETWLKKIQEKPQNKPKKDKFSKFMRNLLKAEEYGVLDNQLFMDAFANAFELNGLTDSMLRKLTVIWQELNKLDQNGRRVLYGDARAIAEEQFKALVNAVSPGARWDNFIFDQYVSGILSSFGSIINQFSGVFKTITGLDSVARTAQLGAPQVVFKDWWSANRNLVANLPLVVQGIKGVPMSGNLPPSLKSDFKPTEQSIQYAQPGQKMRIVTPKGSTITLTETQRKIARMKSLFSWRAIHGAEALSGTTDWQNRFVDVLATAYVKRGMKPAEAYTRALKDVRENPDDQKIAEAKADREQESGAIAPGKANKDKRVVQIKARLIEERLNEDLISRIEQLTAFSQFKTPPVGIFGYPIYWLFSEIGKGQNPGTRAAKFFLLFGRFLGHTVDTMLAYSPMTMFTFGRQSSESRRNKIIKEVFGDVEAYNKQQTGKGFAGTAFLVANGMLMALAQALAGDDEEPVYQIFGNAPMASRDQKEAMKASGKWQEGVVRIFGKDFNYLQIPELAGLFSLLGNASDYIRFGPQLYTKNGETMEADKAAFFGVMDVLSSPIKRSTYRQYFELVNDVMTGKDTDKIWNVMTSPVGGMLRVPVVVDLDKIYRFIDGPRDAEGFGQNLMRRVPFVHVGDKILNSYGEEVPDVGLVSMFPEPGKSDDPDVVKAASINVSTSTVRSTPRITEKPDGTEPNAEEQEKFVKLAGKYYVDSLLRNEAAVRRAFETGGPEAAKKIVSNISSKANSRAKEELGLD